MGHLAPLEPLLLHGRRQLRFGEGNSGLRRALEPDTLWSTQKASKNEPLLQTGDSSFTSAKSGESFASARSRPQSNTGKLDSAC
jgi:hypothetical protein